MSESNFESIVLAHYSRQEVQSEITRYSHSRWVAVHCEILNSQGYPILLRYRTTESGIKAPLTITKPDEILSLVNQYKRLRPRTFYASACTYRELINAEQVKDHSNIAYCTSTWDIDNAPEKWKATIEAAKAIVAFLKDEGLSHSVFLKWSGKGAHVHIHQRAFSERILQRISALDAAYAIVEYANKTLKEAYAEIAEKHDAKELSIENEMDLQRVFTCPLSLHRSLNRVAVCFPPDSLNDFTPDWTSLERYKHWKDWDRFDGGEADSLAEKAYRSVGGYKMKTRPRRKPERSENLLTKWVEREQEL